jgi:hypothetical protein
MVGCLAVACLTAGCLTTERLVRARDEGQIRCYQTEFGVVWEAIGRSVALNGLQLEMAVRSERFFLARSGPEPEPRDVEDMAVDANAGERVAVFVDSAGPGMWAVQVVSRANFVLDPTQKNWTSDVFEAIERALPDSARRPWHYEYPRCVVGRAAADSTAPPGPPS